MGTIIPPFTKPIMFHTTESSSCSYLPQEQQRSIFTLLNHEYDNDILQILIKAGFRRSYNMVYFPACAACQQCLSLRILAKEFTISSLQKRIVKKNHFLDEELLHPQSCDIEQLYHLFKNYISHRHGDSDMIHFTQEQFYEFVMTQFQQRILCLYDHDILIAAMIIDWLDDSLSAIYSFFDPNYEKNSLGSYMILRLLHYAHYHDLDYVYLGYYIQHCQKMSYKTQYKPFEIYKNGCWQKF